MLSICITIKNRSKVLVNEGELFLFPRCIQSIHDSAIGLPPIELVVADWGSDDWPLKQWLPGAVGEVPTRILNLEGPFSRGKGLNVAAGNASGQTILFLDADMIISRETIISGVSCVNSGRAFFPVSFSYKTIHEETGWWRHGGYGNCMLCRDIFDQTGGWPEFTCWGDEDNEFFKSVSSLTETVRTEEPGLIHQWHPNDTQWKDRYAEVSDADKARLSAKNKNELARIKMAILRLKALLPGDGIVILADEATFGDVTSLGHPVLPITEHEEGYWGGPPQEDQHAIDETLKLIARGARWLVFAWPAFWWFEYYLEYKDFVHQNYAVFHQCDDFVVFDVSKCKAKLFPFQE